MRAQSAPVVAIRPRLAGWLCLMAGVTFLVSAGIAGEAVAGDHINTAAAKILSHPYEFGTLVVFSVASVVLMLAALPLIRDIVRPVSERLARLATLAGIVGCTVQGAATVFLYGAARAVSGTPYRDAFRPVEFDALGYLCVDLSVAGIFVGEVFFGLTMAVVGYLAYKSTYLPRALGVIVGISGIGWLTLVAPTALPDVVVGVGSLAGFAGLITLGAWLAWKGVNEERWRKAAGEDADGGDDGPPDWPTGLRRPGLGGLQSENITGKPKLVS